jgi:two-component system, cell cycle response regulator DivK
MVGKPENQFMTKILLVEDNEMNRDMLSRRLERKGFSIVTALDGEQGLALAASELPDLILMDMSLPIIDGWEATRRLKAAEATAGIPDHRPDCTRFLRRPRQGHGRRVR